MSVHVNLFVGLLACLLLAHRANAVYSMAETCKLYSEGYIADPSNCAGWGFCQNGIVARTGKCNEGMLYDSRNGGCDFEENVECFLNKKKMCEGLNAVLKPDPDSCSNYCYCNNSRTECAKCPNGQHYQPDLQSCVWSDHYPYCSANSPCRLVSNNEFVADPNPKNCGGFLRCVSGSGTPGKCQNNYIFNPSNGMCDTFTTMNCPNVPNGNNGEKIPNIQSICNNFNPKDATQKTQFFSDGLTCEGYVVCDSTTNGRWQKCPLGTHFNPDISKCVTPYTYACPYDRCSNLDLNFVTAVGTECGKYIECKNRQKVGEPMSCAEVNSEFPYFAENLGGCAATKPNQHICEPAIQKPKI